MRSERRRIAAQTLHRAGVFPQRDTPCLEIGCGALGWFADLLGWGLREENLHGIDLDPVRLQEARETLPGADLRVADASALPWPDGTFGLVIASTVFTSVVDVAVRRAMAGEITRVLAPGGALLWYDFAVPNPRNPDVRAINRRELATLFPSLSGPVRRLTLAPPIARAIAPTTWVGATMLAAIPFLQTHLLAVLVKHA
jgi:ubiquinone/menaquinone biosynthesis C-methylase UbiE